MIVIVGVGAIGGVCAGHLAARHTDLVCAVRRPFERLVLEHPEGTSEWPLRVETRPAGLGPADWLLFATKAHQTEEAAGWLEALVGPQTRVAVLHNGVEHEARLARWVPAAQIVPVVVRCPATALCPGHVVQRRPATLVVPDDTNGRAFAALFEATPVVVETSADWRSEAWDKLCLNVTSGPIAALAARPVPEVQHPAKAFVSRRLALECAEVARAEGAVLPDARAEEIAAWVAAMTKGGAPSTLTDRLAGRPLEVDARNGAVVRLGMKHGIATPANAAASELMAQAHEDPTSDWLDRLVERLGD